MKTQKRLVAILTAAFILSGSFPAAAVETDQMSEETIVEQESSEMSGEALKADEALSEDPITEQESSEMSGEAIKADEALSEDPITEQESSEMSGEALKADEALSEDPITEQESTEAPDGEITNAIPLSEMTTVSGNETESAGEDETDGMPQQGTEDGDDYPVPDEAPPFHAHIENLYMGYTVEGTFTDFTPDIIRIDTLYSLDGENWQTVISGDWNLADLGTDDDEELSNLQNQYCVYNAYEPMKSYTAGDIDLFYLRLRITKKNGLSYETQSAVIERKRDVFQPIPEGTEYSALFSSAIIVRESDPSSPYRFRMYGRYQLTVPADATAEDISALLPDTLPVEVHLTHGRDFKEDGVVNCPVTWKALSLPRLSPGESITVPDAAEEIIVPEGTVLTTPIGSFQLDEPISLDSPPFTDEVRLVLNVSGEERNPAGVLKEDKVGLKIALNQRPSGASSIQAYVLTEGESKWTELPGLSLLKEMDTQPSTESSGFALVLRNDQEPYQSYLEARKAGTDPTPFFIGLKIEGGIYDGRQLVLAWPDIYDELPALPKVGLSEGNEGNAGADNKNDSTESGQRPDLPQTPEDEQPTPSAPAADGNHQAQPTPTVPAADGNHQAQPTPTVPAADGSQQAQPTPTVPAAGGSQQAQPTPTVPAAGDNQQAQPTPAPISGGQQAPAPIPGDRQQAPVTDGSRQKQQTSASPAPEAASSTPENRNTLSLDGAGSGHLSGHPGNQPIAGQRPNLPQTAPDTSDISAGNMEDSPMFAPLVVQAAEDIKDGEIILASSHAGAALEDTTETDSHIPLLPVITVVAAGGCISAALCKTAGYRPFHWFAAKIRKLLHK